MRVLVLNADYTPYDVYGWKKTMAKLLGERSIAVVEESDKIIRDGRGNEYVVPSVVRLYQYIDVYKRKVGYSKNNVYARDGGKCAYCSKKLHPKECSSDHVTPKSKWAGKGSASCYENCVLACVKCNAKKADKTLIEARMVLLTKPRKITKAEVLIFKLQLHQIDEKWQKYLVPLG